jgi:sulfoxide reductase catalytic subunit YedY
VLAVYYYRIGQTPLHRSHYSSAAERANAPAWLKQKISSRQLQANTTGESITPYDSVSTYNNFYEYGLDKSEPAENAHMY